MSTQKKAINIVRFDTTNGKSSQAQWGVLQGAQVSVLEGQFETTGELLKHGQSAIDKAAVTPGQLLLTELKLLNPITINQQFICQGTNYASHLKESGMNALPFNTIFTKASSSLSPPFADIVRPAHVTMLDYEAELGLVVGKDITAPISATANNWGDYVAGLVIVNDVSARDVQLPQAQFYKGKSYRSFAPVGPHLTLLTREQFSRFNELHVQLHVNGQKRQDFHAGDMIFKPHQTLTELSQIQNLYAGDLIATGTSGGVAVRAPGKLQMLIIKTLISESKKWKIFVKKGASNPMYLKPGDQVSIKIATDDGQIDLGTQANTVRQAS